jgi:glutamate/tyrosine decarboxylase-like PLP-dependent enzyme
MADEKGSNLSCGILYAVRHPNGQHFRANSKTSQYHSRDVFLNQTQWVREADRASLYANKSTAQSIITNVFKKTKAECKLVVFHIVEESVLDQSQRLQLLLFEDERLKEKAKEMMIRAREQDVIDLKEKLKRAEAVLALEQGNANV